MSPEFGSTCAIFPIDEETIRYLEAHRPLGGADRAGRGLRQGAGTVAASTARRRPTTPMWWSWIWQGRARARRPEAARRIACRCASAKSVYQSSMQENGRGARAEESAGDAAGARAQLGGKSFEIKDGAVLIAAITSCTNTSNPAVLVGAGLLARNARALGLDLQALGEDLARARLARGHRLSEESRPAAGPGGARLLHRRLRLHHLHRQFRPAQAGDLRGRQGRRCRRLLRALGQPQFRRPRASGNQDEFPGLPAAGGRVRARRQPRHRHHHRAAGQRQERQAGVPQGHLAERRRRSRRPWPPRVDSAMFTKGYANVFKGDAQLARHQDPGGQDLRLGRQIHLREESALLRRHDHDAGRRRRHQGRARARGARRLGHHRSHLAGRQHLQVEPGRQIPDGTGRARPPTSTPTARAAATTK